MTIKHKNENVFKFKKFSDRISEVDLRSSALYRIEHVNEKPDENQSYFYQTQQKWTVLNLTDEYTAFEKKLRGVNTTTLPQVLHHKEKVIEVLLEKLDQATTLSLQPLLELTVALAKDLREDFYVYFPKFLERLVKLLQLQDSDQTEWTLVCLAFLFKVLKTFLCKDISIVIHQIIPLLSEKNQPEHIINFAVECFAFLVRNLKNKDGFLLSILKIVKQDESSVLGCGKLFFEMIRGLNGQFHSKGDEFLTILFDAFRKVEYKKYWDTLNEILIQTVGSVLDYIEVKNISGYWNILHQSFENILKEENKTKDQKAESAQYMLHFLGQSIEYHGGKKVVDLPKIINLVIQIVDQDFACELMMTLSKIGAVLLLSKNFMMPQLEASRLSKKILHINEVEVFESFVINSIGYSQFDVLILPDFLKYFERNMSRRTLEILANILRQRAPNDFLEINEAEHYNINLRNQKSIEGIVNHVVEFNLKTENSDELEEFLLSIQILPHLMSFGKKAIEKHLTKLQKELTRKIKSSIDGKDIYLLAAVLSVSRNISGSVNKAQAVEMIDAILSIIQNEAISFPCLKVLRFLIITLESSSLDLKMFEKIHAKLLENFSSPYQEIRLLTSQILSSFDHLGQAKISDSDESIFTVFKDIEEITSSIQTYRDQIFLLQKLEYDSMYFQDLRDTPYTTDVIKFCLGFLNSRFQLLWEPTKAVLESFMIGFNLNEFWTIYKEQLVSVTTQSETPSDVEEFSENEFINESFKNFATLQRKSYDAIAYRVKLWQVLADSKSSVHDTKQRDLVELFLNFFTQEYNKDEDDSGENEKEAPKARQKLLINHLQVLAKLNNPKCAYKTDELRSRYQEFLFHRNFQVQKLALDCIIQYKEESLTSYKEILINVLNEKTFRQELVALKLSEKVREEHREGFMKVLLPILYSKMTIKSHKKDQEGFKNKKEIIVRFMSNLKEHEIKQLTDIAVAKIASINKMICDSSIDQIKELPKINLKVNELQSMLHFLDLIKKNVAGLFSSDFHRYLLNNILAISTFTVDSESTMFKNLKQSCLASLVDFFQHFDEFVWNGNEIDILFAVFVWNHLEDFHLHSSQNVSGLMKLFEEWSKNPKYYELLEKADDKKSYAMKSVMALLTNKSTTSVVIESVMDIIERLLTLKLENEVIESVNYGTKIVQPFINDVLMKLKESLSSKKQKTLNQRNLLILSRITELVTDVDSSKILLDILFPLTLKKCLESGHQDTEGITKLMTTISNLLKVIPDQISYIKQISPLFEHVQEVNHRKFLVKMFNQLMSSKTYDFKNMVNDLNAYDRRWIEQPDFERRLSAFHRMEKIINSEEELPMDIAVVFLYHCFYFLKFEKDLAMKDNSAHFLKLICLKMIKQCGEDKKLLDFFVDKIVLNIIQKRIREDAKVRTEAIQLLGELARECPKAHPILMDLHPLTCAANREKDFFDNITHLQTFRHMKGLRQIMQVAESYKQVPNIRTLNDFLLPIGKMFLCQEAYRRKSKVVEAAIEFIATICKFLPWNNYELLLKFYIRRLRSETGYQKQLIKLIPAILDAFHFDLSQVDKTSLVTEVPEVLEEEDEDGNESDDDENEEVVEEEAQEVRPLNEITVLRQNVAQRVIRSLTRRLIPSLFKVIAEISTDAHKLNKETRRANEKADMLKIPIALPIMKLLQKLPSKFLDDYLSRVVLKVSSFLKSTLKQVRATARHTLKEIMISLGPSYLELVIGNLKGMLSKGFQVHVMSVTIHTLLESLKAKLIETSFADKLLQPVLDICMDDIFGKLSEEHDIGKISKRTPEAKASRKSFLTLNILAAVISENCVLDLLLPFKSQLQETQSKKTVIKVQECLLNIVKGLSVNTKLPDDALMILIHGTVSESIPHLLPDTKKRDFKKSKKVVNDSFIIAAEPKRRGAMVTNKLVKTSKQTNSHILVEFGLEMLHISLKKKKFPDESFLNPLVPMLCDSIKSNYLRVNTLAVKCLTIMWHHKLDLENLKSNVSSIVADVFSILHKYATNQISKKDNHYLLVKSSFKCVIVLLRQVEYYTLNENQLKALLLYVEQDLQSFDKDTLAFTLLRSILDKKLSIPEIHEIMKKVAEISVTSESDEKRSAIRPIVLTYLMEYPLGKKIDSLLKFFIAQLNYEEISGRESAIIMMGLIFKHFPQVLLRKFSGLFFLALGARLVNDDSPTCREKIAEIIELLIKQIDNNPRQQLFEVVLLLLKDTKLVHREMAAQLVIRFANAEAADFQKRIPIVLPLLVQSLNAFDTSEQEDDEPGRFVRVKKPRLEVEDEEPDEVEDERDQQTIEDHHLIQTLNAIIRIFEFDINTLKDDAYNSVIDEIGHHAQNYLSHDHIWVRLRALRIINFLIKSIDTEILLKVLDEGVSEEIKTSREFLYSKAQFRSVVFDMAVQLKPDVDPDLLKAIMGNLAEVSNLIKNQPFSGMVNDKKDFNLMWLIRRLRYAVHSEIATAPASCLLRKAIFEYFNALIDLIDQKLLVKLASSMLTPMLREMAEGEHGIEELKQVAMQVGSRIKSKVGLQEYDKVRLELQSKMLRKRVDRRKALAQEKINNPAKAATRTIFKQLKKQDMKKRKRQDIQDGIILPRKKRRVFGNALNDTYE